MTYSGRVAVLTGLAIAIASPVGCGGGEQDDSERIRDVVVELQQAYKDDDLKQVCGHLTRDAQLHVGQMGHDGPTTCVRDMGAFADMLTQSRASADEELRPSGAAPKVGKVVVKGDRATATLTVGDAMSKVPLVKEGDDWKVDALYSNLPAAQQEDKFP